MNQIFAAVATSVAVGSLIIGGVFDDFAFKLASLLLAIANFYFAFGYLKQYFVEDQ